MAEMINFIFLLLLSGSWAIPAMPAIQKMKKINPKKEMSIEPKKPKLL